MKIETISITEENWQEKHKMFLDLATKVRYPEVVGALLQHNTYKGLMTFCVIEIGENFIEEFGFSILEIKNMGHLEKMGLILDRMLECQTPFNPLQ